MDKKPKTVFQLDTPFTHTKSPEISSENQEIILELLCNLLSPIGQHKSNHVTRSKGKRSKKRKRQEAESNDAPLIETPSSPEISSFLAVGLNRILRALQSSSQKSRPQVLAKGSNEDFESKATETIPLENTKPAVQGPFSAIFICRSSHSNMFHEHLPQLIYTSSLAFPTIPATRLVELPPESESRLRKALGIPRVSSIGILEGAPHSQALVDLVRKTVSEVEIPWLQQIKDPKYLPVKIKAIETFSTSVKKNKS